MGGGGIVLRGLAKAIVKPPAVGLAAAAAAASTATATTSSSVTQSMANGAAAAGLPLRAAAPVVDDWVFAGDEERSEYLVRDHLVFGAAPTRDEVEEATSDLQNALGICVSGFGVVEPVPARDESSPVSSIQGPSSESIHRLDNAVVDWIEPHLVSQEPGTVQVRRRNEVAEAFSLLQNDPVVQGVVMSIASDKAVWDAVLSNDKVKEFRKKLMENGPETFIAEAAVPEYSENSRPGDEPNLMDFLAQLLNFSKDAFQRVKNTLANLLSSLISFADAKTKEFAPKDGGLADCAVKSCFMLSVIVLSVVMLKRASAA